MSEIPVVPVVSQIVKVNIRIYNVDLYNSLSALISQYNENDEVIKTNDITLTTQEYNQWQNDDSLVNLLLSKCGLSRKSEPTGATGASEESSSEPSGPTGV